MPNIPTKTFVIIYVLSQQVSQGFVLRDAMMSAGLGASGAQIGENILYQFGSATTATMIANRMAIQQSGISPQVSVFTHLPIVFDYLNAANSREEYLLRGSVVAIFYGACGLVNFANIELATSVSPALALFAHFMAANSCILILPSHYSFGKKIIISFVVSGSVFRLIKKLIMKSLTLRSTIR